jgi:hypothetical protein
MKKYFHGSFSCLILAIVINYADCTLKGAAREFK